MVHEKSSKHHAALEKHLEKMAQHHAKIMEHMKMIKHEKKEKKLIGKLAKMHKKY